MKILIAEDDPVTLEAIDASLSSEGYTTILAKNGSEALDRWNESRPDLVCLDIMMPQIDGFEVCRRIRKADRHLPVLFLSAKNEEIDVVVGLELGADDFIRKPFGKHELVARIRSAIRRSESGDASKAKAHFPVGPWTVYPGQLRCDRLDSGDEIDLSPREVKLLQVLHTQLNEAVERDELLEKCWGLNYFPESRTLDQHIAKLRKKIEPNPSEPIFIETVRGLGYRLKG